MKIDQQTALYGVVGHPVGHSLSPAMQNAAFEAGGLNAVYLAFDTKDIEGCLKAMRALGIRGMSVTIPHKSTVIPLLDEVDELAGRIGAVNTVVRRDGRLVGYNTDARGALRALEEKISLERASCLLLGAGGAARAIGFMLKARGVSLTLANRSPERGEALAAALECPFVPLSEVSRVEQDLLINTTPVGMSPRAGTSPLPERALRKGLAVMDIIYNPLETELLRAARERGCTVINGLGMFVHQGAEQFRLWTGIDAPVPAMTRAVEEALAHEGR